MFVVRSGSQVAVQPHGNQAGNNLSQAGGYNHTRGGHRPLNPGNQREGYCQAIGHADDNIAHRIGRGKVTFDVLGYRHFISDYPSIDWRKWKSRPSFNFVS